MISRLLALIITAAVAVTMASCAGSVDLDDVEQRIAQQFAASTEGSGARAESVTCEASVPAEVGAGTNCTVVVGIGAAGGPTATNAIRAEVTSVSDSGAEMNIRATAYSAPSDFLALAVIPTFQELIDAQRPGGRATSASCPSGISTTASDTVRCTVTWTDAKGGEMVQQADVTVNRTGAMRIRTVS